MALYNHAKRQNKLFNVLYTTIPKILENHINEAKANNDSVT